jgi:hypothetical protein
MNTIVKVQKSLIPQGEMMIYNEDNSVFYQGKLTKEIDEVMGEDLKKYFKAKAPKGGFW